MRRPGLLAESHNYWVNGDWKTPGCTGQAYALLWYQRRSGRAAAEG
jgi:hypothetical protein